MSTPESGGRSRLSAALRSAEVSRQLLDSAPDAMLGVGRDGRIALANSQAEQLFGYPRVELLGQPLNELLPERYRRAHERHLKEYFAEPRTRPMGTGLELFGQRRDGSEFPAEISLSSIETPQGVVAMAAIRDATARKRAEATLREAQERFRSTFENSGIGIGVVAVAGEHPGRLLEVNDALCVVTGFDREQLVGMSMNSLIHADDLPRALDGIERLVRGELRALHQEVRFLHANGDPVWVDVTTALVRDADGEPLYRIDHINDASERKRFEGQLQYLADHDPLTGLFNRGRFREELDRELAIAHRYDTAGAVLFLDIDHFKFVNDAVGHVAGDELIASVAAVVRARLRDTDIVARVGGDEFAIILAHADIQQARDLADSLLAAIRQELSIAVGDQPRRVTISIGIAPFHHTEELTGHELLVEADIAMYDAKEAGRDTFHVYTPTEHRQGRMQARLTWVDRIRDALDNDDFVLHAQPIVSLDGDARPRHELLLRLVGVDGDLIPPGTFLYIAERFGLAEEIDRWVVRRAIELLAELQHATSDACLELNLSAHSISGHGLVDLIADQIAASNVDPRALCFELTETAAIVNIDHARTFARRLSALGCSLALDDFGAGFASFYYLKHLDFDYLKIDGEFIKDLPSSHINQLVVRAVVQIARGLGKKTIAEFVESQDILDLLREEGVDYAQGYHIGRPAAIETGSLASVPFRAHADREFRRRSRNTAP
jgi:diguanylate cyclase (GGDEF)-like protein/PAS domain S-box-containing protein